MISRVLLLTVFCGCWEVQAQLGPRPEGPPPGGSPPGGPAPGGPAGPRGGGGSRPENLGSTPADLGSAGIVWYPILEDGLAEAKRTNKPILFMAVASQCGGVSGVF